MQRKPASLFGKYNFNNDKSTEEVFGFVEGDESWEIKNNTGDRVLWKSDDYTSTIVDEDNNVVPAWLSDFEARYPDTDPPYTDPSQLQEFATWVKSTDPTQATGNALAEAVTIVDGETSTTYTNDTAAYRKAKFRAELGDYVELESTLFYYLYYGAFPDGGLQGEERISVLHRDEPCGSAGRSVGAFIKSFRFVFP